MSFKLGNTTIGELYVGSNKIAQAYLGSTLVYQAAAPGPTPTFDEITIGTQTWMAKNLAIDDGGAGITIVDNVTSNGVNFGTQYYYDRAAAIRVANTIQGWHLPTSAEWNTLNNYVGSNNATKLKSTSGWPSNCNGTDDYGFTILPVGILYEGTVYPGQNTVFHTTDMNGNNYIVASLDAWNTGLVINDYEWDDPMSIRLVKD